MLKWYHMLCKCSLSSNNHWGVFWFSLQGNVGWPVSIITDVPTPASVKEALETGPYGKCVYEGNNNVCDNQVRRVVLE